MRMPGRKPSGNRVCSGWHTQEFRIVPVNIAARCEPLQKPPPCRFGLRQAESRRVAAVLESVCHILPKQALPLPQRSIYFTSECHLRKVTRYGR